MNDPAEGVDDEEDTELCEAELRALFFRVPEPGSRAGNDGDSGKFRVSSERAGTIFTIMSGKLVTYR